MSNATAFAMLGSLIIGWALGWLTVSTWLVRKHGKHPAFAHLCGAAFGTLSALGLFCIAGSFFDQKEQPYTKIVMFFMGLGLLAPFAYVRKQTTIGSGCAPTSDATVPTQPKPRSAALAPSSILVSIDGHDGETTQRMGTLCESMGLSPVLGPAPTAVLAIVGPNTAFQFSTFGIPTVSPAEAPRMLELVVAKVAANPDTATLKNLRQAVDFGKEQFDPDHSAFLSLPALPEDPQHHRTELEHARIEDVTHSPRPRNTKPAPTPKTAQPGRVSLPHTFTFVYRGQDGNYSRRTVDVSHVATNGGHTYLEGFCHERGDTRTFRTDRMRGDLTDMETGELVPIKRLVANVHTSARMDHRPTGPTLKPRPQKQWQTAVLFTGFSAQRRDELEALAISAGWSVRVSVGSTLDYLVSGPKGGPSKVAKAEELGVTVIDEDTFRALAR